MRSVASSGQRPREVLIAGAGVAALEALLALRRLAGDRVSIDLVAPVTDFEYRPLAVMEPFGGPPAPRLSIGGVVRDHGAGHVFQRLAAVEPEHHRIRTAGGDEYGYETLILATGAQTVDAIPGALSFPGRSGGARYRELLGQLQHAEVRDLVFAVPAQTPAPGPNEFHDRSAPGLI